MSEMSERKHVTTECRASQVKGALKDSLVKFKQNKCWGLYAASLQVEREFVQNAFQTFEK